MRSLGKAVGRLSVGLLGIGAVLWWLGPYEPVDLSAEFEPRELGAGVQRYFDRIESGFSDITQGTEKRVVWAGQSETRTPVSVLYLHGFSATSEEIRPVPDRVAQALAANLVFTRLRGHGRSGDAMADARVSDWMHDLAEGLAAARAIGDRVVILATSTGATLAAAAAVDQALAQDVAAMVLVSPNFGLRDPAAKLLTLPAVRWWGPLVAGETQSFQPQNAAHARYWTNSYPTVALLPMAALVKAVVALDFSAAQVPALFYLSDDDSVVRPDISRRVAADWGGPATVHAVTMGEGGDPSAHVIAGDILSPGQTDTAVATIVSWLAEQGI